MRIRPTTKDGAEMPDGDGGVGLAAGPVAAHQPERDPDDQPDHDGTDDERGRDRKVLADLRQDVDVLGVGLDPAGEDLVHRLQVLHVDRLVEAVGLRDRRDVGRCRRLARQAQGRAAVGDGLEDEKGDHADDEEHHGR
jgi:hypothetical protein